MAKTLVVIPAYNEAENIPRLLPMVVAQAPNTEVLVVDDHSPDGTATLVKDLMAADPRIHLVERAAKMGLGTAYVAGFRYAIANAFDYVVSMDADFSHDPAEIRNFLEKIQGCDLVVGSRYVDGVRILNWPMSRLLLSYFGNLYSRFITGLPVCDATSGFKCYRRGVLEGIDLDRMKSNGYAFQIEMVYKAWKKGFTLAEVPITFLERRSGASKMSRQIVYEAVFMVWKLRLRSLFNRL